mmetsp:Transcript_100147/g.287714  ORF Transcript_100147/g.287714 Transcript_100147/m.287714 type:complete len:303 (-) Transcript_100147:303-1211(-)
MALMDPAVGDLSRFLPTAVAGAPPHLIIRSVGFGELNVGAVAFTSGPWRFVGGDNGLRARRVGLSSATCAAPPLMADAGPAAPPRIFLGLPLKISARRVASAAAGETSAVLGPADAAPARWSAGAEPAKCFRGLPKMEVWHSASTSLGGNRGDSRVTRGDATGERGPGGAPSVLSPLFGDSAELSLCTHFGIGGASGGPPRMLKALGLMAAPKRRGLPKAAAREMASSSAAVGEQVPSRARCRKEGDPVERGEAQHSEHVSGMQWGKPGRLWPGCNAPCLARRRGEPRDANCAGPAMSSQLR